MPEGVNFPSFLAVKITEAQMAKLNYAVAVQNQQHPPQAQAAKKTTKVTKAKILRQLIDTLPEPPQTDTHP